MEKYQNELLKDTLELLSFDGEEGKPLPGAPFGEGNRQCLDWFLSKAESFGFQTKNLDGYCGVADIGEGEAFGILGHLDTVPVGDGWTHNPYGEISGDVIYGRGVVDDRGPMLACLYAVKSLLDEGLIPKKRIRFIVGCNEENGWACIEHYNEVAHMPDEGFSPDGSFPVIYAEKGILHVRLHFPMDEKPPFFFLEGGSGANMVCDECSATPRTLTLTKARELGLEVRSKKIIAHGRSAHGSTPELGENAILPILRFFEGKSDRIKYIIDCVFNDRFRLTELEDETGRLTLSPNIIKYRKGEVQVICDIRYPATVPYSEVIARLAQMGVKYETIRHQPPLMQDKKGALVQTLLKTYEACTGICAEPIAIGGGTYAKMLPNVVAFGPLFAGDPVTEHQPDECIDLERLVQNAQIIANAIVKLANLPLE